MNRIAVLAAVLLLRSLCAADAPEVFDEKALRKAELCSEEGNFSESIRLYVNVLRQANDPEVRDRARTRLDACGFTPRELLTLDVTALTTEKLDDYANRIVKTLRAKRKKDLDYAQAAEALRLSVQPKLVADGTVQVTVSNRDLITALKLYVTLALNEQPGEYTRTAQRKLEDLGVVGDKFDLLCKTLKVELVPPDDDLFVIPPRIAEIPLSAKTRKFILDPPGPPANEKETTKAPASDSSSYALEELSRTLSQELVAGVCLEQLAKMRATMTENSSNTSAAKNWEEDARLVQRRKLGLGLYKYVIDNCAETSAYKRSAPILLYWEGVVKSRAMAGKEF